MTTLPIQQIDELSQIVDHLERHWTAEVPPQWVQFMLLKISVRIDRLKESQLGYCYQPDAKKLILHAMEALADEFGEATTEEIRERMRGIFLEVKQIESQCKSERYARLGIGEVI